jgi:hypothetical protein
MAIPISEIKDIRILMIRLENDKIDAEEAFGKRATVLTPLYPEPSYCRKKRHPFLDEYENDPGYMR